MKQIPGVVRSTTDEALEQGVEAMSIISGVLGTTTTDSGDDHASVLLLPRFA